MTAHHVRLVAARRVEAGNRVPSARSTDAASALSPSKVPKLPGSTLIA